MRPALGSHSSPASSSPPVAVAAAEEPAGTRGVVRDDADHRGRGAELRVSLRPRARARRLPRSERLHRPTPGVSSRAEDAAVRGRDARAAERRRRARLVRRQRRVRRRRGRAGGPVVVVAPVAGHDRVAARVVRREGTVARRRHRILASDRTTRSIRARCDATPPSSSSSSVRRRPSATRRPPRFDSIRFDSIVAKGRDRSSGGDALAHARVTTNDDAAGRGLPVGRWACGKRSATRVAPRASYSYLTDTVRLGRRDRRDVVARLALSTAPPRRAAPS